MKNSREIWLCGRRAQGRSDVVCRIAAADQLIAERQYFKALKGLRKLNGKNSLAHRGRFGEIRTSLRGWKR